MEKNNKTAVKTWIKGNPSPYQLKDRTHFPDWGGLTVWDAFFNNLASGLMLIGVLVWLAGPSFLCRSMPIILSLALVLVLIDLVILVFDLGDPWRFYHCLRVMRFTSPLSVGVWALCAYSIFLTLATFFSWIVLFMGGNLMAGILPMALRNLFIAMAAIAAIVVICYKGVVFSCTSQPGLCQARWLTSFLVSDSLLMGYGLFTLATLVFVLPQDTPVLIAPFLVLIFARCITFGLFWQDVKARARKVYHSENRVVGWGVLLIGGLAPVILVFMGYFGLFLASVLVLCCGLIERHWLIGLPRPVNAA